MRTIRRAAFVGLIFAACTSSTTSPPHGAGGSAGSNPATGGSQASGGQSGSAGTPATGGSASSGGAASKGVGGTGAGGKPATGGNPGTGGSVVDAGTGMAPDLGTGKDAMPARDLPAIADLPSHMEAGSESGGAGGYQPCPSNGDPCKVLPLGDSITFGALYDGGYRVRLFTKAVAAAQKITFTGSQSNGPTTVSGKPFPRQHEGHGGWTISTANSSSGATAGVSGLIPSPAFDTKSGGIPHIILLMIGTNDVYAPSGQSEMAKRLGDLIDKIVGAAPDALLAVAKITPFAGSYASHTPTINTYNDAMPGLVKSRADAGKHVVLVDLNTGFSTSTMLSSDGVHPNQAGYEYMGEQWYAAIASLLPK
jgi:lysophospholipase L1-like esterase